MILYIDESECDEYFILTGLLAPDRATVEDAFKHFKKRVNNLNLNNRTKEKVYREFKSIVIDHKFQRIKLAMLEEINLIDNHFVIYSTIIKKNTRLRQELKEKFYIEMIVKIANKVGNVSIIFDEFKNDKFESKIINELLKLKNVDIAVAKDSQSEHGLQFADNLCSVIRLHLTDKDINNYYEIIESSVMKV